MEDERPEALSEPEAAVVPVTEPIPEPVVESIPEPVLAPEPAPEPEPELPAFLLPSMERESEVPPSAVEAPSAVAPVVEPLPHREMVGIVGASAKRVSLQLAFFMATLAITAIGAANTTHEALLRGTPVAIPFLGVTVPLLAFYGVVPAVIVALHVNLLRQIRALQDQINRFESEIVLNPKDGGLLLPTLVSLGLRRSYQGSRALAILLGISAFILPLLVLVLVQTRFLPYHHGSITAWHRLLAGLDAFTILASSTFWGIYRAKRVGKEVAIVQRTLTYGPHAVVRTAFVGTVLAAGIYACGVAVLPGTAPDGFRSRLLGTGLKSLVLTHCPQNLILRDKALLEREVAPETLAMLEREAAAEPAKTTEANPANPPEGTPPIVVSPIVNPEVPPALPEVAVKYFRGLDLRERDLRGAIFDGSTLVNADFRGALLDRASFGKSVLTGAKFAEARISASRFRFARLEQADFADARVSKSDFQGAVMTGLVDNPNTEFVGVNFEAADLNRSTLAGRYLRCVFSRVQSEATRFIGNFEKSKFDRPIP